MKIDIVGNVNKRQELRRNGGGDELPPGVEFKVNPGKDSESAEFIREGDDVTDFGEIIKEVERTGSSADQLKVKSEIIPKEDIGEPTRVVQIWQSGDMYGITIGSKFYHVDPAIQGLFVNAVKLNRSLKLEVAELERKLKVYRYGTN